MCNTCKKPNCNCGSNNHSHKRILATIADIRATIAILNAKINEALQEINYPTLQKATERGNTTDNYITFKTILSELNSEDLNKIYNSLTILQEDKVAKILFNTYIDKLLPTSIELSKEGISLNVEDILSLAVTKDQAIFGTKVSGLDAVEQNDYITLKQSTDFLNEGLNTKVDKVENKSLVDNTLINKLAQDYTKAEIDQQFNDVRNFANSSRINLNGSTELPVPPRRPDNTIIEDAWVELSQNVTYIQAGGSPITGIDGHRSIAEWNNEDGEWVLVDMGELSQEPANGNIVANETKAVNGGRVFTYLQGLLVGNEGVIQTTLSPGTFNQSSGTANTSINWIRTLPYQQQPNTKYLLSGIGATSNDANAQRVAFYRADGSYIGFLPSPGATNSFEYTTPPECVSAIAVVDAGTNMGADVPNSPYQQIFSVTPIEIEEPKLVAEKIRGKIETEQVQLLDSALVHDNNNFKEKFDFTEGVSVLPYKKIALPSSSGVNHLNFAVTKENDVSIISTKIDFITTVGSIRLGFGDKNACFQFVKTQSSNSIVDVYEMSRFGINVSGSGVFIPATALSEGDFITLIRSGLLVYLYINGEYVGYKDLSNVGRLSGHLGGVIGIRDNVATWVATDINYKKRPAPYMHLSVDDCITSFQWITQNTPTSIFEDPRFSVYKEMHDKYGACISLYCFYQTSGGSFNLSQMPDTYKQEFIDNSDWLKIGFHGVDSTTNYTTIDTTTGVEHYNRIVNEIYRFAGYSSIDNMPRFSMFKGNNDLFTELKEYGLVGVLTADDTRTDNSGLSTSERTALGLCDDYYNFSREFYYIKSEWRLDTTNATQVIEQLETLYKSQNNRNVYEMFWHQGREINSAGKEMIEAMCQWAVEKGIRFDFPQNNIFGK